MPPSSAPQTKTLPTSWKSPTKAKAPSASSAWWNAPPTTPRAPWPTFMFTRKAVFEIEMPAGMDKDELELELIDYGLDEITSETDEEEGTTTTTVYTAWTDYGTMHDALEERKVNIVKANLQRFPNQTVSFTDEQMVEIEKFLDKLDEDEDIQAVYTNME